MANEYLSKHFTLREMTVSDYAIRNGIENVPDEQSKGNLIALCTDVMEKIRERIGLPVIVTSGFRSIEVNKGIGGAQNPVSQHTLGEAADFHIVEYSNLLVIRYIVSFGIPFDQLIYEGGEKGWVHISYTRRRPLRKQLLNADFPNGKAVYSPLVL